MSDRKVICPWCGDEMELDEPTAENWEHPNDHWCSDGYKCSTCGGSSGGVYGCITRDECKKLAYENAIRRPPNLPLTREQVISLPSGQPVVLEEDGYDIRLRFLWEIKAAVKADMLPKNTSVWSVAPTLADIEAARD